MFLMLNNTQVNQTFEAYKKNLYPMIHQRLKLNASEPLTFETARYAIDEILTNQHEKRYSQYTFTPEELA